MLLVSSLTAPARAQEAGQYDGPIIDVHLHAYLSEEYHGASTPNPVTGEVPVSRTAEEHMRATLAEMERQNVVLGLVGGPLEALERWREAASGRILAGAEFGRPDVDDSGRPISVDTLRSLYQGGRLQVMGEITAQYEGLSPSDPALDPYFSLAEELDIPVGIHTGTSFPNTPYDGAPSFRVALGNPLLLEDLLVRHPDLRVFIMHGGLPWQRETVALMQMYPQVYMDVAVVNWIGGPQAVPRFHEFLRDMVAEGLGKRIMFGTDQMRWPEAIGMAIESVRSADFLTAEQKADIFYHNAARFLELSEQEIARHHSVVVRSEGVIHARGSGRVSGESSPLVLAPAEGHVQLSSAGVTTRFVVGSVSTGASGMTLIEATFPPGHETATHLHEIDEELVYVLDGELTSTLEGEERTVEPGGVVFVPPHTWMALANRTDRPIRLLVGISRGEAEECFRVLFSSESSDGAVADAMSECRVRLR